MKLSSVYSVCLATSISTLGTAMIWLDPMPAIVQAGDTYRLNWTTDHKYDLELLLVKSDGNGGWEQTESMFQNRYQDAGDGQQLWSAPFNVGSNGRYGIWLGGMNVPDDHGGYANITNYFQIVGPLDKHDRRAWPVWQIAVIAVALAVVCSSTIAVVVLLTRRRAAQRANTDPLMRQETAMVSDDSVDQHKLANKPRKKSYGL